ncbi:MAG: ATP-binding protein [Pseudomonadota bacterium]
MGRDNPPGKLKIAVIGGGRRCLAALEMLESQALKNLQAEIVGVADLDPQAAGITRARQKGLFTTTDCSELFGLHHLDLVIELTDDRRLLDDLAASKPESVGVIGQAASRLFHDIVSMYQQLEVREDEVSMARSLSHALINATSEAVMVLDRDYRIRRINNAALAQAGLSQEQAQGKYCFQVSHQAIAPCDNPEHPCPMMQTWTTGQSAHAIHEHGQQDGSSHYCNVSTYPMFNRRNEVVQVLELSRDITNEMSQRMESRMEALKADLARLVQEDKLIALGKLVASVAHEINNPITGILNFVKLVIKRLGEGRHRAADLREYQDYLTICVKEADRCIHIVRNLLSFSRQQAQVSRAVNIPELLGAIITLTENRMRLSDVALEMDLAEAGMEVWGDPCQLQQVFTNLIFNAMEAMPQGGRLRVTGGLDPEGQGLWLEFADTGEGIAPENLPRIFEPFFSTKPAGVGVGLGLSMVYGIVRDHGGEVEVDSQPGEGTTFRVTLPRAAAGRPQAAALAGRQPPGPGGPEPG